MVLAFALNSSLSSSPPKRALTSSSMSYSSSWVSSSSVTTSSVTSGVSSITSSSDSTSSGTFTGVALLPAASPFPAGGFLLVTTSLTCLIVLPGVFSLAESLVGL